MEQHTTNRNLGPRINMTRFERRRKEHSGVTPPNSTSHNIRKDNGMKVKFEDLNQRYEELTSKVICTSEMATPLAGGQPATREGIEAFVKHHLNLEGSAVEDAIRRILTEE